MYSQLIGLLWTKEIKWDFPINSYNNIWFSHVLQLEYTIVVEREYEWKNFIRKKNIVILGE